MSTTWSHLYEMFFLLSKKVQNLETRLSNLEPEQKIEVNEPKPNTQFEVGQLVYYFADNQVGYEAIGVINANKVWLKNGYCLSPDRVFATLTDLKDHFNKQIKDRLEMDSNYD